MFVKYVCLRVLQHAVVCYCRALLVNMDTMRPTAQWVVLCRKTLMSHSVNNMFINSLNCCMCHTQCHWWNENISTLCLKKVPTFKLSVTWQILTNFQNVCTAGKCMKFAIKPIWQYPPHLRHVATLPWEIKKSIFGRYSADWRKYKFWYFRCLT